MGKNKFKIGDKVIVCGIVNTKIEKIKKLSKKDKKKAGAKSDGYWYCFYDELGKSWRELSYTIKRDKK